MSYDPGYHQAARETFEKLGIPADRPTPRFARGDVDALRKQYETFIPLVLALDTNEYANVEKTSHKITGYQGGEISVIAYHKRGVRKPEPAILYIHGGGMILGSPELFEKATLADVAATGVAHFSVDYRLAPEHPHPTPVEDSYAALVWLSTNAQQLGVDASRLGVMGLSAGGGIAAGVAILARDRELNPPLVKQILLEPMLDDRNTTTNHVLLPLVSWSWDDNWTGWNALLGDDMGSTQVSEYAAPARLRDATRLAPAYIDLGSLDVFAEETQLYAEKLKQANVLVEWHIYEGVPHGFELRGTGSQILNTALKNRRAAMQSI